MNSAAFSELCDAILGTPGVDAGFIHQSEALETFRGARKQQGFDVGHRRTASFRIWLSDEKKAVDVERPTLREAVHDAFAKLGIKLPDVLEALEVTAETGAGDLIGRGRLRVVSDACFRCGETKSRQWEKAHTVHVRLGRCLAPVDLVICEKCTKQKGACASEPRKEGAA